MNYDWASTAGEEYWEALIRHPDRDELLPGYPWDRLRSLQPEVSAAVLDAQGKKKLSAAFRKKWREKPSVPSARIPKLNAALDRPVLELDGLPAGSFVIEFQFRLAQPMLTRDDSVFAVADYAVRTDRVTGRPFLAASSWKGCLVGALYLAGHPRTEAAMIDLFGNEKNEPAQFQKGSLCFYPSYFSKRAFRVLNPHDRKKRSGTVPIEIEVVPKDERSWFHVLSVPRRSPTPNELWERMDLLMAGIVSMFRRTGFGAKTSSGFGSAANVIESGRVTVKGQSAMTQSVAAFDELASVVSKFRGQCEF